MVGPVPRKTIYAATAIAILALVGGWTIAAGSTVTNGPAQHSSVTVTAPAAFQTAIVQSTQMLTVSGALIATLSPAGTQATGNGGLNSTVAHNALLAICATEFCQGNYSAVNPTSGLTVGDTVLQVMLTVTQPLTGPVGFDVQVEIIYDVLSAPTTNLFSFGTGYFDTQTTSAANPAFFAVALYVDFGTAATNLPSASDIAITMNACQSATVCP
ncbi:MAG TPA: hypothetical protein VMI55_05250 [Thermoplasmata archaeon]|nr:hypothetical protein [Thermoplasmata archaeon]